MPQSSIPSRSILAIDSSTELASVCVFDGGRFIERREDAGQRHSAILMELVRSALDEARIEPVELDEVAFGAGPGSFTGLRIACGIAQGIAYGARVPVRAVSSLMAVAQACRAASGCDAVIAAIDARMNEVYWAAYRWETTHPNGRWTEAVPPAAEPAADIVLPPGNEWCGAGNAFARFAALTQAAPATMRIDAAIDVTARSIAELALSGHGVLDDAAHAMPVYVRDKVAMTSAERIASR